jgi:hypothetical protein
MRTSCRLSVLLFAMLSTRYGHEPDGFQVKSALE